MSVYHPSFNYLGVNSRERNLIVTHFESDADVGDQETFLSMEPIYTESSDGTRRLDYGARYNSVAQFRITMAKPDGSDFSVSEVRHHLKWLTGSKKNSPLDLVEHFSEEFVCDGETRTFNLTNTCSHIFDVYLDGHVLDSFVLGKAKLGELILSGASCAYNKSTNSITLQYPPEKGSVIKVAYSQVKYTFICRVTNAWQHKLDARTVGIIIECTSSSPFAFSAKQTISQSINGSAVISIDNDTDDIYGYTPVNVVFANTTGNSLTLMNRSTGLTTKFVGLSANEVITMSDNMMVTSDKPAKIFGNTFNFVFQQLVAGINNIDVQGTGNVVLEYVMAYKIGNCSMDITTISDPIYDDDGHIQLDVLPFSRITDLPSTFQAYNIKNVYSKFEVDTLISGISIDEIELSKMLQEELN